MTVTPRMIENASHEAQHGNYRESALTVRDSFHSLIGDIWLSAVKANYFTPKSARQTSLSPIFMWDSAVPLPNIHTAVAWYMTLEDPITLMAQIQGPFVPPPISVSPHDFFVQDEVNTYGTSQQLVGLTAIRPYLPSDFYGKLHAIPEEILGFDSQLNQGKPHKLDSYTSDEILFESVQLAKLALCWWIANPPGMRMTVQSSFIRGISFRNWSNYGLVLSKADEVSFASSPVILTKSMPDFELKYVPSRTPPIWFGFSEKQDTEAFMSAYWQFRPKAIEQLLGQAKHPGVQNKGWEADFQRRGLLVNDKPQLENMTPKQRSQFELDALLDRLEF